MHAEMHVERNVARFFKKIGIFRQMLVKLHYFGFYENLFGLSQVVKCGWTEGRTDVEGFGVFFYLAFRTRKKR